MVPHVGQLFAALWNLRFQFTRCRGRAVPSEPRSRREEREALASLPCRGTSPGLGDPEQKSCLCRPQLLSPGCSDLVLRRSVFLPSVSAPGTGEMNFHSHHLGDKCKKNK